jgi:tripartite-type tricarboxylate transporter receptor subunit TctC
MRSCARYVEPGAGRWSQGAGSRRQETLPDVPTSYEQGLPEFDCAPFYAVFAPHGTPQPIIGKLTETLNKGLSEEQVQKRLADLGADIIEPGRRGPQVLADLVRSETARLMPILKSCDGEMSARQRVFVVEPVDFHQG